MSLEHGSHVALNKVRSDEDVEALLALDVPDDIFSQAEEGLDLPCAQTAPLPAAAGASVFERLIKINAQSAPVDVSPHIDRTSRAAFRRMALFRRHAPLLEALIDKPGMLADDRRKEQVFRSLIVGADRLAKRVVAQAASGLLLSDSDWLVNMAIKDAAQTVSVQWRAQGRISIESIEAAMDGVVKDDAFISSLVSAQVSEKAGADMSQDSHRRAALRMTLLGAMGPIASDLAADDRLDGVARRQWLAAIGAEVMGDASTNESLANSVRNTSDDMRIMLVQNYVRSSLSLMAAAVRHELERSSPTVGGAIAAWRDAHAALLETVDAEIERAAQPVDHAAGLGAGAANM